MPTVFTALFCFYFYFFTVQSLEKGSSFVFPLVGSVLEEGESGGSRGNGSEGQVFEFKNKC